MQKQIINTSKAFLLAVLNSYGVLFFANNKLFSALLLMVSFFNPFAGFSGLVAAITAIVFANSTGLNSTLVQKGTYSYNALIIGIGLGTMYNFSIAFWLLLVVIVMLSVVLSSILQNKLSKHNIPFLTIPFVICMWLVQLGTADFEAINFSVRNIYWLNEMYAIGDDRLVHFLLFMEKVNMPPLVVTFFKALSSLYFQTNILAGIVIAFGILLNSRIIFCLIIIGFLAAYGFNTVLMAHPVGMNYYLIGGNFILVSVAIGGFFTIPSIYTYTWAVISVPITFLIVMGLGKIMGKLHLPVYSMPFSITVIGLLYFFGLKKQRNRVVLTPVQLYAPEKNLYHFLNSQKRLYYANTIRLQLPFLGEWMVSQAYDGTLTHKGDWAKALDFIIVDNELKTYNNFAALPEHFYCYNKPVVAAANGYVVALVDDIDDNEIGQINQTQNWGNTIVIKHAEYIYTKLSHLKKQSYKVKIGDYVKQGDIVAMVGNSGRSPEPHLHFQVQSTPYIGSKTLAYPLASFMKQENGKKEYNEFSVPVETDLVSNVTISNAIKQAFDFLPGYRLSVVAPNFLDGNWEVFTDAYNQSYIYCHNSNATVYFVKTDNSFYCTAFYGSKQSLLYHFYTAAYKVLFCTEQYITLQDQFPLELSNVSIVRWLQDIVAPFYIFSKLLFKAENKIIEQGIFNTSVEIHTQKIVQYLGAQKIISNAIIAIENNAIKYFSIESNNKNFKTICTPKD